MRDSEKAGVDYQCSLKPCMMINNASLIDLQEARLEIRRLMSTIDRLKETELSLRSQVDKVCYI